MLKHADIWRAIDRLAEKNGLSPSGLARKAGLSPTLFNPSKRSIGKRKRWPSTESISLILQATGTELDEFVGLGNVGGPTVTRLPLLGSADAARDGHFDESGYPTGRGWIEIALPASSDPHAFAIEVTGKGMDPYREGDRLILSPMEKPRRGDRVAVRTRSGEVLVKQLGREGAQKLELNALDPDQPPVTLNRKDVDWIYRITWASQ